MTKVEMEIIKTQGRFDLLWDGSIGMFSIVERLNESESKTEKIEYDLLTMYKYTKVDGVLANIITFNQFINKNIIRMVYEFIVINDKTIINSIKEIEALVKKNFSLTLQDARGIFAELEFIKEYSPSIHHENAIFDFAIDGNYVDVKSYSKDIREIMVSSQQATNSEILKIFAYEIVESNEGMSIKSLILQIPGVQKRYGHLTTMNSEMLDIKFKSNEKKIFKISNGEFPTLPAFISKAKYTINVDLLSKELV